jgi:hypothetical protein
MKVRHESKHRNSCAGDLSFLHVFCPKFFQKDIRVRAQLNRHSVWEREDVDPGGMGAIGQVPLANSPGIPLQPSPQAPDAVPPEDSDACTILYRIQVSQDPSQA